jgi:hypothetical protein
MASEVPTMNDYPVRVGSMLFTLVDPEKGHEVAYNRWYERDHFYAGCMVGPWLFAGKRWVATREMKDLRFPKGDTPVASPGDAGSYLATYWVLEGRHKEHFDWASDQVVWLYANERGFANRIHRHTVLLDTPSSHYRDADPVPVELAFDHPYKGLAVVTVDPAPGVLDDELNAYLHSTALPALMKGSGVASMVSWHYQSDTSNTDRAPMDLGMPAGPPERNLQMFFLDQEPTAVWERFHAYADDLASSGKGQVTFAAPFLPTIVGTDTYTDQLW